MLLNHLIMRCRGSLFIKSKGSRLLFFANFAADLLYEFGLFTVLLGKGTDVLLINLLK